MKKLIHFFAVALCVFGLITAAKADSVLVVSSAEVPLRANNYAINSIDAFIVPGVTFRVKSESGNSVLKSVGVSVAAGTPVPVALHLYDGPTLVGTTSAYNNATVEFSNVNLVVPSDTSKVLTVKMAIMAAAPSGSVAQVGIDSVTYEHSSGQMENIQLVPTVEGPGQHLYNTAAQFSLMAAPTVTVNTNTDGSTGSVHVVFPVNASAFGGNVGYISNVSIVAGRTPDEEIPCPGGVLSIPYAFIANGSSVGISVFTFFQGSQVPESGVYRFRIKRITWTPVGGVPVDQTWGFEDFLTPNAVSIIKPPVPVLRIISSEKVGNVFHLTVDVPENFAVIISGDLLSWDFVTSTFSGMTLNPDGSTNGILSVEVPPEFEKAAFFSLLAF